MEVVTSHVRPSIPIVGDSSDRPPAFSVNVSTWLVGRLRPLFVGHEKQLGVHCKPTHSISQ